MAARVAAELKKNPDVEVEIVKGGLGEFAVTVDGRKVHESWRWGFPNVWRIMSKLRASLG